MGACEEEHPGLARTTVVDVDSGAVCVGCVGVGVTLSIGLRNWLESAVSVIVVVVVISREEKEEEEEEVVFTG